MSNVFYPFHHYKNNNNNPAVSNNPLNPLRSFKARYTIKQIPGITTASCVCG